jgi:acetyltransferase-like isoleucine patch superfamily enzyme
MFLTREQIESIGFKHVGNNVLISDKAVFYNPHNITIGDHSRIDDFCILSASGQIEIGRYVHIACYTSIIGAGNVMLKDYAGLSSRVSVFSSSDNYNGEYMTNPCLPARVRNTYHLDVYFGKHVVVGAGSTVLPGVILADGCSVGAMTFVNSNFEADSMIVGIPGVKMNDRKKDIYKLEKFI